MFIALTLRFPASDTVDKKREFIVSLCMVLYAAAVVVIAFVLFSNGVIAESYIADCLKAAGAGIGFATGMFIERVYIRFSEKSKSVVWQGIKFIVGLTGVIAIQQGLKLIIGSGLITDMVRYFLMLMWVTVFFPLLIKRFFKAKE